MNAHSWPTINRWKTSRTYQRAGRLLDSSPHHPQTCLQHLYMGSRHRYYATCNTNKYVRNKKKTGSTTCLKVGEGTGASSGPRLSSGSRSGGNSVSSRRLKLNKETPYQRNKKRDRKYYRNLSFDIFFAKSQI
jgi:hypothetical protein